MMDIYIEQIRNASAKMKSSFDANEDHLLQRRIRDQITAKVTEAVESEYRNGALDNLTHEELQLLTKRLEDPDATEFELTRVLVDALVPRPTGEGIRLQDRGVNVPDDKKH